MSLPKINRDTRNIIAIIPGVILFVGLGNFLTWFGPDPYYVIRASSKQVPSFRLFSKEDTVEKLEKIAINKSSTAEKVTVELSEDGKLNIFRRHNTSGYESNIILPLSQLDTFIYAEQARKGKRYRRIEIFCANYKKCINISNNQIDKDIRRNNVSIFSSKPDRAHLQTLGLLNRLLELHDAQSTIEIKKNTIRIYWDYYERQ